MTDEQSIVNRRLVILIAVIIFVAIIILTIAGLSNRHFINSPSGLCMIKTAKDYCNKEGLDFEEIQTNFISPSVFVCSKKVEGNERLGLKDTLNYSWFHFTKSEIKICREEEA